MSSAWKSSLAAIAALILVLPGLAAAQPAADPGLLIAGQPTSDQLKKAAKAGYRSVIDLRAQGEDRGFDEEKVARKADLAYSNIEVTPDTLSQSKVLHFLMVAREAERPTLLHCQSGNRAGAMYYAWLVLEKGVPEDQALERAQGAGLKNPDLGEQIKAVVAGIKASQRPPE
jgi:uncharacterized protein (TIGR01244 family)